MDIIKCKISIPVNIWSLDRRSTITASSAMRSLQRKQYGTSDSKYSCGCSIPSLNALEALGYQFTSYSVLAADFDENLLTWESILVSVLRWSPKLKLFS